jgi:hypothetical protein
MPRGFALALELLSVAELEPGFTLNGGLADDNRTPPIRKRRRLPPFFIPGKAAPAVNIALSFKITPPTIRPAQANSAPLCNRSRRP